MATTSLDALRLFSAVAEARSFTAAARRLRLDKSQASRVVRSLEDELGVTLLVRTTRAVRTTPEGEQLLARLRAPLAELEDAASVVPRGARLPSGLVTVTTTADLARWLLAPALVDFRLAHPAVQVRVVLGNERVDLVEEGIDLALRVGHRGGGSFVARPLFSLEAGFYASPAYLERRGRPSSLDALRGHERLWPPAVRGRTTFSKGTAPPPASVACEDFVFLAEVARAGGGIALLPTHLAAREIAAGALVRVLPEVTFPGAPLYLVSRAPKTLPARVRALRDLLLALHGPAARRPA